MRTIASLSFMLGHLYSADHLKTEDTGYEEEGAHALVLLNIFPDALGLAVAESLTLD